MPLIVLLRGVNVGGHRRFRPTLLARALKAYDVVNIGAAGTFVVREPGNRSTLRAELRSKLPDSTSFVFCEGRDLLRLEATGALKPPSPASGAVRFVSFLAPGGRAQPTLPLTIPSGRDWLVRVTSVSGRLVVGDYRRDMKTIGCLGQLDALFGTTVTTRSLGTVNAILRVLRCSG
jgi:hypothetical protein